MGWVAASLSDQVSRAEPSVTDGATLKTTDGIIMMDCSLGYDEFKDKGCRWSYNKRSQIYETLIRIPVISLMRITA